MHKGYKGLIWMSKRGEKKCGFRCLLLLLLCSLLSFFIALPVMAMDFDSSDFKQAVEEQNEEARKQLGLTEETSEEEAVEASKEELFYQDATTGYQAILQDEAGLLSASETELLLEQMKKLTAYGNVAFISTNYNSNTASYYAESRYRGLFGRDSGTVFLVDMDNRMLYIFSDGAMYKVITKGYANTITDNVYRYATDEQYYTCASAVFEQEFTLLEGNRIFQPMKYTSNILLALVLSAILNYGLVRLLSHTKTPSEEDLLKGVFWKCDTEHLHSNLIHEIKKYNPQSSGGVSSGGSGGGSSGGGGGHSF